MNKLLIKINNSFNYRIRQLNYKIRIEQIDLDYSFVNEELKLFSMVRMVIIFFKYP